MMTLEYKNIDFDGPLLTPYFIPVPLKLLYNNEAFIKFKKKREVELELRDMPISKTDQEFNLLKRLENRFNMYGITVFSEEKIYTYFLDSFINISAQKNFSGYRKCIDSIDSYVYIYNVRHCILNNNNSKNIKSTLLYLTKGGSKLSFFGQRVVLLNNKIRSAKKKTSYHTWMISNLKHIGMLNNYDIYKWKTSVSKTCTEKRRNFSYKKKMFLYYKNVSLNSSILLKKNEKKY